MIVKNLRVIYLNLETNTSKSHARFHVQIAGAHRSDASNTKTSLGSTFTDARPVAPSNASAISISDKEYITHFLPDVGWMIKFNERRFLMLFSDGMKVTLDAKLQTLELQDHTNNIRRYLILIFHCEFAKTQRHLF